MATREEQIQKFKAIQAREKLAQELERQHVLAERESEIVQLIEAVLVAASESEKEEVRPQVFPRVRTWALTVNNDYSITEYVNALVMAIRARKAI
jgi:hypothetical protein